MVVVVSINHLAQTIKLAEMNVCLCKYAWWLISPYDGIERIQFEGECLFVFVKAILFCLILEQLVWSLPDCCQDRPIKNYCSPNLEQAFFHLH